MKFFKFVSVYAILAIIISACVQQKLSSEEKAVRNEILTQRAEKDSSFKFSPQSPIPDDEKAQFGGLKYYEVDLNFRFTGPIVKYDSMAKDTILGSKGELRPALRYGYFEFEYQQKPYRLQILKFVRDDPEFNKYLFLGFTDATSGTETYGAGRYIDLIENDQNQYTIDFNMAFNPYCAYNPRYTCAIPLDENYLPFKVTAGEKVYKSH